MASPIVSPAMTRKAASLAELLPNAQPRHQQAQRPPVLRRAGHNRMMADWTAIDGSGCTCLGYQRRGLCTHSIAAKDRP